MKHKFNYNWKIKDGYPAKNIKYHGKKVFSCFACGGGSTMGYKLAGYDVIGFNEIDERVANVYIKNHKPKYSFIMPIQDFKDKEDLPEELFDIDLLDGSPPCSSFSMAGARDKFWGKKKKFREGQEEQVLDELFFHFLDLLDRLKPKTFVVENVKGLLLGKAVEYFKEVCFRLSKNYFFDHKVFDASKMGIPQKRERVFIYGIRKDISKNVEFLDMFQEIPGINMDFEEREIPYKEIREEKNCDSLKLKSKNMIDLWMKCKQGEGFDSVHPKGSCFNEIKLDLNRPLFTITSKTGALKDALEPRKLSKKELMLGSSFPLDFDFLKQGHHYILGMSVPPLMTANIADRIYNEWLINL